MARILLLFFIVGTTYAFQTLIPEGKEVTYRYESTSSTKTLNPKAAISTFNLHGILHLQKHKGNVFAKLRNLTYQLFNGLTDADHTVKTLPIPEGQEDFSKTFKINYLPSGVVKGISVGRNEKEYVVNFKRGLAAVLQLNTQMIAENDNGDKYSFESEEETLRGKQKVLYNIKLDYRIDVLQEGADLHGDLLSSFEYEDVADILRRDNQRSLKLMKKEKDIFMEKIEQTAGIYYNPFNGRGEEYTLRADQKLILTSVESIEKVMAIEGDEKTLDGLRYHEADFKKADTIFPDITNGRRALNYGIMGMNAPDLVKKIFHAITQMKLQDSTHPEIIDSHILHRLTRMLLFFDKQMFNDLEQKLGEGENAKDYLNIYHGLLSEVGTHASYNHILHLRNTGKADESLLNNMFANVKYPNKKLVDAMGKEILNWGNEKSEMYNSGILSFATLLHKAAARHEAYKHNPVMLEDYPDETYYEKYVLFFLEKLKNTESYDMQILYLQALYNARFNSTVEHLLPAVNGKWWEDEHLRMMAGLAINPLVAKNEDLTVKIYWPIMTNSKTMISFRIMAYYMIMKTKPRLQRLFNIYFVMESVKNEQLYKFHYSYITGLAKSDSPKNAKIVKDLIQILKYTRKPYSEGLTTYYNLDYYNKEFAFGEQVELLSIYSKKENELIILGSHDDSMSGLYSKPSKFVLRIAGFHPRLLQQLKFDTSSSNYLLTWKNFKDALLNIENGQNTKLTLIITRNDQVTSTKVSDGKGFYDMLRIIKHVLFDFNMDLSGIQAGLEFSRSLYLHASTDLGFPVIFYDHVLNIKYHNIKTSNEMHGDKIKLSFNEKWKHFRPSMKSLSFYNPFSNLFQGVEKAFTRESYGDLQFDILYDMGQGVFKFSWMKPENANFDEVLYAERNYVKKMVYAITDDSRNQFILQQSCEKCMDFQDVALGENYKTSRNLISKSFSEMGMMFIKNVFDIEEPLPTELNPNINIFVESRNINDFKDIIKLLMATKTFEELQPNDVNYGSYEALKLDPSIPLNKIDLTLKLKSEYEKNVNYLHPAVMHKLKLDFIAGTPNKTYRTLFIDAEIKMDEGHLNNEYKINILRDFNEKKWIASIEGDLRYNDDAYNSNLNFIFPQQNTTKENPMLFMEAYGEKSQEQNENKLEYSACFASVKSPIDNGKSLQCFFDYTAFRFHTFTIISKIPASCFMQVMNEISNKKKVVPTTKHIWEDELKVYLEMPIKPSLDYTVEVYERYETAVFSVSRNLKSFLLKSAHDSTVGMMRMFGLTNVCMVDQERKTVLSVSGEELEDTATKELRLYLGSNRDGAKFEVWIMTNTDNNMAIRIVLEDNTFTIDPQQEHSLKHVALPNTLATNSRKKTYIFAINGKRMEVEQTVFTNNWLQYVWVKNSPIVSVYLRNIGVHIVYNGNQANIEYPEVEGVDWKGICLNK